MCKKVLPKSIAAVKIRYSGKRFPKKGRRHMDFNGVYHRANDNYCYALDEENLIINLKTGYDVKEVYMYQGDPFKAGILGGGEHWEGERTAFAFKKRLKHQLWWTITVRPEYKRLKYYFELITDSERWFYFEDGFVSEAQMRLEGRSRQCFVMPWMNPSDIAKTPEWVNNTIWYQIFPERFCNGRAEINPEGTLAWREEGTVKNSEFFGGDIPGIIQKLDYLQELGITGIYLTPINVSPSTHKYDVTDYMKIDPHFGTEKDVKELVEKAHSRGIRIMADCVFNHCGYHFAPWKDVVEKGPESAYFSWFMINQWPFEPGAAKKKQYYSFAFFDGMPKLNTNNEEVRKYLLEVCRKWVQEIKVDGLRLDVANEVSHTFCKELHWEMKTLNPDIYILGEIWHDAAPWLRGDEFDAVMNYPLGESIKDFWIDKSLSGEDFEYMINRCYTGYMQQTNDVLFNLLDSHDTGRLRSQVENIEEFYQLLAVLFAMPGSPCIYYGTELAMEGGHDPDCRRCMPWEKIERGEFKEQIDVVKQLIHLRKEEKLLQSRNFHFPAQYENPRVVQFTKSSWVDNYIEVILNCSDENIAVKEGGEILFSRHFEKGTLGKYGILFRRSH